MLRPALAALVLLGLSVAGVAGTFNKKVSIGDPAPSWSGLETVDGKGASLAEFKDKEIVVVVFTCNHCPVSRGYEDRLIALAKQFAGADSKVAVVALNVNAEPEEKLPLVKERAKEKGFNFPCAVDPSQKVGRAYGAVATPSCFVLDKDRKIAYMGALDDNLTETKVKSRYVEEAIQALLKGEKIEKTETRSAGCSIEYGMQ
jgi:peroxiredoxin